MRNKKLLAFFSFLIILAFIVYIIIDIARKPVDVADETLASDEAAPPERWRILHEEFISDSLKAVAVSSDGYIYVGGGSLLSLYDKDLSKIRTIKTPAKITAIAVYGDTVFTTSEEQIFLFSKDGKLIGEWGPFEANSIITSVSANRNYVAVADAGNKIVFILNKRGEVKSMTGHFGEKLIIPSPYFDVCLTPDNVLYMAHTGNFRVEKRSIDGRLLSYFGESGSSPEAFCGCCNPAHFTLVPQGFITAEKGINRIKILDPEGGFTEFVSSVNDFVASVPLDVASADGRTIYGANPADGKLYVFVRR